MNSKSKKLTKGVKEIVARRVVEDLFVPALLEQWKTVEAGFSDLVEDVFKDFDWERVEPYRKYINWHKEMKLCEIPSEWQIHWDDFRRACNLPAIGCIEFSFEYPSRDHSVDYLDSAYKKRAEDILRPYMVKYFTAKKYYEDVNQVLLGIGTYRQLEETVPELVKYLPAAEHEEVTALVPIEQINRVRSQLLQKEAS